MIPVAIDPEGEGGSCGKVYWADIGSYPYREWQHIFTVATLAQRGEIGESFATDFAILQDDRILADPIEPSGFLFHISRCGSTRSEEHTSELQSLMRISYAVFCLKKKKDTHN